MLRSYDPTSPSTIANIELIAAGISSLTLEIFFGAYASAARLGTPRRTRDTDKKAKRGEFHIHIAKLGTGKLQQIRKVRNENTYLRLECESCS